MKKYVVIVFAIMTLIGIQSCDKDLEIGISGSDTFYGAVAATPCVIKNGETVTFSIEPIKISGGDISIGISTSTSVNGKNLIKSISYYLDGRKVVSSDNIAKDYSAEYIVTDLVPGDYTVSAHCESNFKDYKIIENISETTIIIE